MEIVAIANQKGGCGKTTTAINLAAALGQRGKRVLLVDMDPQGHASLGLGQRSEERPGLYEVFLREVTLAEVIIQDVAFGVDLVPGTISLAAVEHLLADTAEREWRLASHLAQLEGAYDFTVIDCPPSLGLLSFNALRAADRVLVPVELSAFALDGLERLSETIELLAERYKTDIPVTILPVMVDQRPRFAREMLRALRDAFAETVAQSSIHYTVRLKEAALAGLPIFSHEPRGMGAMDYDRLGRELMGEQVGRVTVTAFAGKRAPKAKAETAPDKAGAARGEAGKGRTPRAAAEDDDSAAGLPANDDENRWEGEADEGAIPAAARPISRWAEAEAIGVFGGLEASAIGLDDDPMPEPLAWARGRSAKGSAKAPAKSVTKTAKAGGTQAAAKPGRKAAAPKRAASVAKTASTRPTTRAVSKSAQQAAPARSKGPRTTATRRATTATSKSIQKSATPQGRAKTGAYARMSDIDRAGRAAAGADAAPTLREVVLAFDKLPGHRVQVAGDFNDWIPDRDVVTRKVGRGVRKVLKLRPGAYQYRVIVDGIWQEDPGNPERVPNIYGGENSLLHVEAGKPAPSA